MSARASASTTPPARRPIVPPIARRSPAVSPARAPTVPLPSGEEQARIRARAALLRAASVALRGRAAEARAGSLAARARDCTVSVDGGA